MIKVNRTYVINEEQVATIRMVFTLYSQGYGEKAIVNELSRLGRKDGHGNVSWSCTKISRILRNATYMGYVCYNKSKVNNYLEKKRINNLDETSSYYKRVVFIDRSPAECYNSFRVLWIGEALLPQRRFLGGSNHSFFVEMLIS